jgi:hypothetical protein
MNKKFLIGAIVVVLAGIGLALFLSQDQKFGNQGGFTENEINQKRAAFAAESGETNAPTQAVLAPIDLSHSLRLAIGGLGLADEDQNRQLGDLVTVGLTGERGFNLVERQSLAAILHELNLSWSGFVRAKDAVRAGKLLKADWFLLGTEAKINGTNSIVARVVDARTGVMRDAGVFPADKPSTELAADLAAFMRQCRLNAASPKLRVYLAVGAFEDLSVNNRQADFPTQLRGYLTAAYGGSSVTLLEREYVETLLQEVHLDLAGLTEESWSNTPPAMQSAYWLVSGQYQSYETTNFQIELNLEVQRAFGKSFQRSLRAEPGEPVGRQTKAAIDAVMNLNSGPVFATRRTEARMQMEIGRELWKNGGGFDPVWVSETWTEDEQVLTKQRRKLEDAIRSLQTVLLLEPTNREARIYLAACLRRRVIFRLDDACNYYRDIIDEPTRDKWSGLAEQALVQTFKWFGPQQRLRWYQSAASQTTNSVAAAFYSAQADEAQNEITMNSGDSPKAGQLAEKKLIDSFQSYKSLLQGESGHSSEDMGMDDYIAVFKWDRGTGAQKLAEMLPKMQKQAPGLEPYLLATVLTHQLDTNTPLVAEFAGMLDHYIEHPDQVLNPLQLWNKIRWSVYDWCFEKTNYALAIKLIEGEKRVAAGGKVALLDFDDMENIKLAYAYLAAQRWQNALAIFESFTNRPVKATGGGPWGEAFQPILTDKLTAFCRIQLGTTVAQDTRKFDLGKPVLCLCSPSTFVADDSGLWVGIGGRLLNLDFELKTNLAVKLPLNDSVPITVLCLTSSSIWIGTRGAGLIEFDKASHQCRRLTEADGLMMDDIASLEITGDSLWIGYGGATGGGLGQLDLRSRKLSSFMPSLNADVVARTNETPPRDEIKKIVAGSDGDLWMSVASTVRQFHVAHGVWETLPKTNCEWVACFSAGPEYLVEGGGIGLIEIGIQDKPDRNVSTNDLHKTKMVVSLAELNRLEQNLRTNGSHRYVWSTASGGIRPKGAVAIQNLHNHGWQNLEDTDGFPNPPSTLTLDGDDLWVGGEGAIALVDLKQCKVRKYCHIKAERVDRIQIAGSYVWAQFDWHLYRVSLSALN